MKIYVTTENLKRLPTIDELVDTMWGKGISLSRVGVDSNLKRGDEVALSWDKWIDDHRWSGHQKSKEYIYLQLLKSNFRSPSIMMMEMEDDAVLVDKRAFYKGAFYIAEKCGGKISQDKETWMSKEEFYDLVKNYLTYSFKEAIEASLT